MTSSPVWLPSWLNRMPHPIIAAYPMSQLLELRAGPSVLVVSPETGGLITRYASDHAGGTIEWLRPALPDAVDVGSAGDTSCFPMVPFSNRIREARFHFRGRLIQLPQNFFPEPHAIMGMGGAKPGRSSTAASTARRSSTDMPPAPGAGRIARVRPLR